MKWTKNDKLSLNDGKAAKNVKTNKHMYDQYFHMLTPALESKMEEFAVLGYKQVSKKEIWEFLTEKIWRNPKEGIRIYELVSDILSFNVGDYMNYATVEAFKSPDLFSEIDQDDLQQLLNPKANK